MTAAVASVRARTRRSPWLVLPIVLALTGCGSTALRGAGAVGASDPELGLDGPVSGSVSGSPSPTAGPQSGTPGAVLNGGADGSAPGTSAPRSGSNGGTGGSASGSTGGTPVGTTTGGTTGGPVNKAPIKVGVIGIDAGAIGAVFGAKARDPLTGPKAFVAGLNKAGGIGGRPVSPVYYVVDSGGDANTVSQEACAAFTQDNLVQAVVGGSSPILASCLARKGIPLFDPALVAGDTQQVRQAPNVFMPSAMAIDRVFRGVMESSAARGFLKSGATLGVVSDECAPSKRTVTNVVVPLAKRFGVKVVQASFKCVENLVADIAPVAASIQGAVLKLSSAGAKSVLFVSGAEAFALSQFTTTASQQKYLPKYLISSNAYPWGNSQSDATIKISPDAMPNLVGSGYLPLLDIGSQARPATAGQKAAQDRCNKIDPTQGGATGLSGTKPYFARNGFFATCDAFFGLKAALEADGMRFGYADVARGYAKVLASGVASSVLAGGRYGGGASQQLDGAGFMQPFAYDAARQKLGYVGKPFAVA